jgi:hypothetical protein
VIDEMPFMVCVRVLLELMVAVDGGALADAVLDPLDVVPFMCLASDWKAAKSLGATGAFTENTIPTPSISQLLLM